MKESIKNDTGWIELIAGSMFCGKTEELMRRMRRAMIAKLKCAIFKHDKDKRYSENDIVSHDQHKLPSIRVSDPWDIYEKSQGCQVVGIDEAQFFNRDLVKVCNKLAEEGKRVVVAGLDQDFEGKPFGYIHELFTIAEYATKIHAICTICGNPASKSKRLTSDTKKVVVGGHDKYEPRCRKCYHS